AQALDLVTCSVSPVVPVGDPPASVGTKLLPTVGAEGALFGSAVDLSGDTAIVGHGGNVSQ
ncbi:MAG: hypothetical protein GWN73_04885, partial [Actinobacteria bacterium]|nr:hypothetical protein [Actinomycetota bacterium]NIU64799.1 hypothetical protein [Actinomycetota bacterium]NIW26600.1 hypothetical protein [Actinomycetota bacterium]